jgi:hypothetical protein
MQRRHFKMCCLLFFSWLVIGEIYTKTRPGPNTKDNTKSRHCMVWPGQHLLYLTIRARVTYCKSELKRESNCLSLRTSHCTLARTHETEREKSRFSKTCICIQDLFSPQCVHFWHAVFLSVIALVDGYATKITTPKQGINPKSQEPVSPRPK